MENHSGYNSFRIAVPEKYQDVFSHFYFADNRSLETVVKTLIPSYQTILLFSFGNKAVLHTSANKEITVEKCLILGPIKQAFNYALPPGASILVASFKDEAFYRFFEINALASNQPLNPDDLLNDNCFSILWEELQSINDVHEKVQRLLDFAWPYLKQRNSLIKQLTSTDYQSLSPIKAVAIENGVTERNIQLNYKKYLGYSAKERNRYQRFLEAITLTQKIVLSGIKVEWMQVVTECGYYDQSQLINDFKHHTGLTPGQYLKLQKDICTAAS